MNNSNKYVMLMICDNVHYYEQFAMDICLWEHINANTFININEKHLFFGEIDF